MMDTTDGLYDGVSQHGSTDGPVPSKSSHFWPMHTNIMTVHLTVL